MRCQPYKPRNVSARIGFAPECTLQALPPRGADQRAPQRHLEPPLKLERLAKRASAIARPTGVRTELCDHSNVRDRGPHSADIGRSHPSQVVPRLAYERLPTRARRPRGHDVEGAESLPRSPWRRPPGPRAPTRRAPLLAGRYRSQQHRRSPPAHSAERVPRARGWSGHTKQRPRDLRGCMDAGAMSRCTGGM